jgi:subtilisin family serine protease
VRVLNAKNKYDDAKVVARGVVWAVDHGARVINLSLGGGVVSSALADAIDYAFAKDVVVVACVGNVVPDGPTAIWHPASEPGVLAVTALTQDGVVWKGSLTGPRWYSPHPVPIWWVRESGASNACRARASPRRWSPRARP